MYFTTVTTVTQQEARLVKILDEKYTVRIKTIT